MNPIARFFRKLFKSGAQRRDEAQAALRFSLNALTRWEKTLDRRLKSLYPLAKKALEFGEMNQYKLALGGISLILKGQSRARAMRLRIEIASTMYEMNALGGDFSKLLGKLGRVITGTIGDVDFMNNQKKFEEGLRVVEGTMDKLDYTLNQSQCAMETMSDMEITPATDDALSKLIDAEIQSGLKGASDADIEARIKRLRMPGSDGDGK